MCCVLCVINVCIPFLHNQLPHWVQINLLKVEKKLCPIHIKHFNVLVVPNRDIVWWEVVCYIYVLYVIFPNSDNVMWSSSMLDIFIQPVCWTTFLELKESQCLILDFSQFIFSVKVNYFQATVHKRFDRVSFVCILRFISPNRIWLKLISTSYLFLGKGILSNIFNNGSSNFTQVKWMKQTQKYVY